MDTQNQKYNIICFSNQLWDFPNWTNKRHVMTRLARQGHNIVFVDPPINFGFVLVRQILKGLWSLSRIFTMTKEDADSGAKIYSPINFIPDTKFCAKYQLWLIKRLAKKNFDPTRETILWIYHVQIKELFYFVENLDHDVLIYDCVDNYAAFPDNQSKFSAIISKAELPDQEERLTKMADLVFASAPGLVIKLQKYRDTVHFTPNVGDYHKFKDAKKIQDLPKDIKALKRPLIGFAGALDTYKFDLELFKKIAADNPSYSFVLIGQIAMKDRDATLESIGLAEYDNVHFLGYIPYDVLENYYAAFDAYIIPYALNDYTIGGCFPVKFHDALAVGLPTIVTDLPAYSPFKDVSYISKSYQEFSDNIGRALKEDNPERIKARKDVAKENNWDGKVEKMLTLISELSSQ